MRKRGRAGFLFIAFAANVNSEPCPEGVLTVEEWDYVQYLNDMAATSVLPRQAREICFDLYQRVAQSQEILSYAVRTCPAGVATLAYHALPEMEKLQGEFGAMQTLEVGAMAEEFARDDILNGTWAGSSLWYQRLVPLLFGKQAETSSISFCEQPNAPKIYVYDHLDWASTPIVKCAFGMEGVEVLLHRYFLYSKCRTMNPGEADYFFVPFYSFCYQNMHISKGNEGAELNRLFIEIKNSLPYFSGDSVGKHIWVFPHEFWSFPDWRKEVGESILYVVEANGLEHPDPNSERFEHCPDCFDHKHDVVLPGHNDFWAAEQLRQHRDARTDSINDRPLTACFMGSQTHELYRDIPGFPPYNTTAQEVRDAIFNLAVEADVTDVFVASHMRPTAKYYEKLSQCKFCFVPKGVGFTNGRLMESFSVGCIPTILSDGMKLPFPWLPWQEFSIKFPMPRDIPDARNLLSLLRRLNPDIIQRMADKVKEVSCWFDYYSEDPHCSAQEGVFRNMADPHFKVELPQFWFPEIILPSRGKDTIE